VHRAVLLAEGGEIGIEAVELGPVPPALAQAPLAGLSAPPVIAPPPRPVAALIGRRVEEVERELILETLSHCLGNRTRAAEMLGISIRTLRNKLHEYRAIGVAVPPAPGTLAPPALPAGAYGAA
jgi:two-component system response regulator FlrC